MVAMAAIFKIYFELLLLKPETPIDSKLGRKYRGFL